MPVIYIDEEVYKIFVRLGAISRGPGTRVTTPSKIIAELFKRENKMSYDDSSKGRLTDELMATLSTLSSGNYNNIYVAVNALLHADQEQKARKLIKAIKSIMDNL